MGHDVRVRFAPSPTGYLHVGGVRAFLFNWLFARKQGGKLVLRIDDTDQKRSTPENVALAISDLKALGVDWDEGPDCGGPYGPYSQSERLRIYADHAKKLVTANQAYYCFCSPELIGQKREVAIKLGKTPIYDGTCAAMSSGEALERMKRGERAGIRFRAPQRDVVLEDVVRGRVEFRAGTVGDFLITRSPEPGEETDMGVGMPVYNFCCVIDDALMKMSHIIRGEDHLSNTARQLMIYEAFGWQPPVFAHTAMVLGADKQKLSKRNGDVSAHDYLNKGYLPDALLNFLALLGWWPTKNLIPRSGHPEILSRDEMITDFDLSQLTKSAAVFDMQKLRWMNGQYLKASPVSGVAALARPYFDEIQGYSDRIREQGESWYERVIATVRGEVALLSELPEAARIFFEKTPSMEEDARKLLQEESSKKVIFALMDELKTISETVTAEDVARIQKEVGSKTGTKGKGLFMPIRAAVTGRIHGPELKEILPLFGKARALERISGLCAQVGIAAGV